ncbi:putative ribonuclease H-like domain-containing protein [Tanacetum coccineum]|uniref:Ribonuclease H-like domain-containing protein n=1 Tax=Tanacetum coccineum TaxID=301880 RepID=A0ABQ5A170_9ASTR
MIPEPTVLTQVQETSSTKPITTLPLLSVSTTPPVPQQTTTPIPTPPITTDALTITTAILESDALYVVQLRVSKLEKDVSELKNVDHSATTIATLNASEIIKIKREQTEKQKTPKFTIKSTDKAACKEYDQKNALNQTMHANKSFNKKPANHKLYHALMEALIDAAIKSKFGGFGKIIKSTRKFNRAYVSKEDINQKYLRSLPPSWSQIALIMRNKPDIDKVDIDDLYNNLRVYENELKRSSVEILGLVLLGGFNLVYLLKCHDSSLLLSCSTHQTVPHVRMRIFSRWNGVVLEGLEFRWAGGYVDCQSKDMFIQRHEEIWTFKGKNDLPLVAQDGSMKVMTSANDCEVEYKFIRCFNSQSLHQTLFLFFLDSEGLEKQLNHHVKIIRCDNGTEFKNYVMNELCAKKGIKGSFVKASRGTGLIGMFDLIFLTNSLNSIPVSVENLDIVDAVHKILWLQLKDVVQDAENQPSEHAFQTRMPEDEQVWQDELEMMVTQEVLANAMNDESRQAFEEEKRRIASQKKATQATSTNQLSTDRPFVSTDRSNTPNVSATSTSIGANANESSFVYLRGKIPIDASTLPNADLPIDPNMLDLEDASDTLPNDRIFNRAYDDDEDVGAVANFNNMDTTFNARGMELLQFKLQQVWILVDLPFGKKAIGTKWVFRNKRDKRSIVVKNKVRLVAQGHRQEEGIDYDEIFAPGARIEAIRLFLAFASYMGFLVYQMDVKSAFLYGTIEEEVYGHQPLGFVDPAYPNKVYKVVKALYGLLQDPRAWYETLSSFQPENGFRRGTIDKTLFIKKNKSDIMLVQVYVDDIIFGSTKKSMCTEFEEVMHKRFQMSSMGELTFFLGLQVKQQPDGIFISQDNIPNGNLKYSDKHNICVPHWHPLLSRFPEETNENVGFTKFWQTATVKTLANGTQQLVASIDSKEYIITEAYVRSKLQLADATGIHNLSDAKIYAGLATLGINGGALLPTIVDQTNILEKELKETKQTLGNVVLKLVKKVKSLEKALKRKSKKVLISESEGEESEDQGRKIQDIDDDPLVSLVRESMKEKSTDFVTPTKASGEAQEEEIVPTIRGTNTLSKVASQGVSKEKSTDKGKRYRRRARSMAKKIDTGLDAEEEINTGREEINTGIEEVSTGSTKVDSGTASERGQREGKPSMVDRIFQQGQRSVYQIIRANRADTVYMSFGAMIKDFTREDLIELYRLVMQKYGTNRPEDAYDRVLWSDLRAMFDPPLIEDAIWSLPLQ